MVEWLERSSLVLKVLSSNAACARDLLKTLTVHPAVNGYPTVFRAGQEGRGVTPHFSCTIAGSS